MSASLLISATTALMPAACAERATSWVTATERLGAVSGFTRTPMVASLGTMSRNSPNCFAAAMLLRNVAPVMLPPGRLRLVTMPASTGSPPVVNTIGMVAVAGFAASTVLLPPTATITATRRRTSSAASAGSRRPSPSAER